MTNTMKENKNTDAVAQVRERLVLTFGGEGYTSLPEVEAELDALIAAVRAECADRRITMTDAETFTLMARCRCGLPQVCANGLGCSYHAAPAPREVSDALIAAYERATQPTDDECRKCGDAACRGAKLVDRLCPKCRPTNPTDAVAQARDGVWRALEDWQNLTRTTEQVQRELDAALAAQDGGAS